MQLNMHSRFKVDIGYYKNFVKLKLHNCLYYSGCWKAVYFAALRAEP
jgi:hypothetical protein